jgi:23S rRNA (cytosine1962-C5)-methyltransferase
VETPPDYELLDAGAGRRLERFGAAIIDRPAPALAAQQRRDPGAWSAATARFERPADGSAGSWVVAGAESSWLIAVDELRLELRLTPAGNVGFFPEHVAIARWAAVRAADLGQRLGRPAAVLNLFAHTGLATLAVAAAGASVVHIDSSRPAVSWARRNAEASGLAGRAIRWIVEDAGRFVAREVRRGRRYDGVILDPPTYGHGPRGRAWELDAGLTELVAGVGRLLADGPWFAACTAHAAGLDAGTLERALRDGLGRPMAAAIHPLELRARSGVTLPAGWAVLADDDAQVGGG